MDIETIHEEFSRDLSRRVDQEPEVFEASAPGSPTTDAILKYLPFVLDTLADLIRKLHGST